MRSVVARVMIVVGVILSLVMLEYWLSANQPVTSKHEEPRKLYAYIELPGMAVWLYQNGTGEWSPREDGE